MNNSIDQDQNLMAEHTSDSETSNRDRYQRPRNQTMKIAKPRGLTSLKKQIEDTERRISISKQLLQRESTLQPTKQRFAYSDSIKYMKENIIRCHKYHYSVPQTYTYCSAVISLTKDEKVLRIFNITGHENQHLPELTRIEAKIPLDEIHGFIYGSFSTRFWMMRLGINQKIMDNYSKNKSDENRHAELPFYSWECITIQHKNRDIDLVIKDEDEMAVFLKFLIIKLNTFNGRKNSISMIRKFGVLSKSTHVSDILLGIYRIFRMMKIKMKISYEACRTNKTIQELFLIAILTAYHERNSKNLLKNPYPKIT